MLVSGDDRPLRRPGRGTTARGAVLLLVTLVVLTAALLGHDRAAEVRAARAAAAAEVLHLSLGDGSGLPRHGPRPPGGGLHLELRNDGLAPVRLLSGSVSSGQWRLELDRPVLLGPGETTVLPLSRTARCSPLDELRSYPVLRVEARVASGRRADQELDLTAARLAYGGELGAALRAPELGCRDAAS